jgi:hypothetical protein
MDGPGTGFKQRNTAPFQRASCGTDIIYNKEGFAVIKGNTATPEKKKEDADFKGSL